MGDGGGDIIIKGGSVDLYYDESLYPKNPIDPNNHRNENRKVVRVLISGAISYDSGDHPEGLLCEIRTITR